jgi:hypothetical protein
MTQVQTMTNPELNRKLAVLMGYRVSAWDTNYFMLYQGIKEVSPWCTENGAWTYAPNYCSDPAASLEVEKASIEKSPYLYPKILEGLIEWDDQDEIGEDYIRFNSYANISRLLISTPRQRAEAAYITLQGAT